MMDDITPHVKNLLDYDPDTGVLRWKQSRGNGSKPGDVAGWVTWGGYLKIMIHGKHYSAHRLAFVIMTGAFPPEQVDHINGRKLDNRWCNLRAVTQSENQRNAPKRADNKSGVTGVCWHSSQGRWVSLIKAGGKQKHLGVFDHLFDAVAARKSAERAYGFHENHGRRS